MNTFKCLCKVFYDDGQFSVSLNSQTQRTFLCNVHRKRTFRTDLDLRQSLQNNCKRTLYPKQCSPFKYCDTTNQLNWTSQFLAQPSQVLPFKKLGYNGVWYVSNFLPSTVGTHNKSSPQVEATNATEISMTRSQLYSSTFSCLKKEVTLQTSSTFLYYKLADVYQLQA